MRDDFQRKNMTEASGDVRFTMGCTSASAELIAELELTEKGGV